MVLVNQNSDEKISKTIFNWAPTEEQWWITGFNTKHKNPDPDVMVSIVSIDLSKHPKFYEALKNTDADINYVHDIHKDNLIFDDNSKTVWLQWYT